MLTSFGYGKYKLGKGVTEDFAERFSLFMLAKKETKSIYITSHYRTFNASS